MMDLLAGRCSSVSVVMAAALEGCWDSLNLRSLLQTDLLLPV